VLYPVELRAQKIGDYFNFAKGMQLSQSHL